MVANIHTCSSFPTFIVTTYISMCRRRYPHLLWWYCMSNSSTYAGGPFQLCYNFNETFFSLSISLFVSHHSLSCLCSFSVAASVTRYSDISPLRHDFKNCLAFPWVAIYYLAKLWTYFAKYFILLGNFHCSKWPNIEMIW